MRVFLLPQCCYCFDIPSCSRFSTTNRNRVLTDMKKTLIALALFAGISSAPAASYGGSGGKDIGSFMERLHKGKNSYADKAKKGQLTSAQLTALARNYRLMLTLNPPKNKNLWRKSVGDLVNATARLARSPKDRGLISAYSRASDCRGCHNRHR